VTIYSCVEKCVGCRHMNGPLSYGSICEIYMRPYSKWNKLGGCEGATHVERKVEVKTQVRVGQQKQKKAKK